MMQIRRKNKKLGDLCPICNNAEYEIIFTSRDADLIQSESFEVVRCIRCKLTATSPFLNDDEMSPWYRNHYHGWWQKNKMHLFTIITNLFQRRRFQWIKQYAKDKSRLLDIGCGDGTFIKFMQKQGFNVRGIENPDLLLQVQKRQAIEIEIKFKAGIPKPTSELSRADIVTLWQVLEHVANPLAVLLEANCILKPGGLLIISVPNFKSMQSALCRSKWFHLDIPRHRWHFCPQTMFRILKQSGFSVVRFSHFSLEYNPFGWFQSLLNVCLCSPNFVYNLLKRRELPVYKNRSIKKLYDILGATILGSLFIPIASIFALVESILHRGGVLTIVARKENETSTKV